MRTTRKALLSVLAGFAGIGIAFFATTYFPFRREMKTVNARLLAGSTVLDTSHGQIEYAVRGEGSPVLVLHGAGGYDQGLWSAKVAFGPGHKIISVSRFGYLRTPIPANASIEEQAAMYKDLLDHLNIAKVIVLGTSAGGPSAMEFANDYPDRTSALVLLSAVTEPSVQGDKPAFYIGIINTIQRSDYAYWIVAKFTQSSILNLMGVPGDVYAQFSDSQKQLAQEMLDTMHPMSRRYAGTMNDGQMVQRDSIATSSIEAPTLILHAKDDALVSFHHAEHAQVAIKGSQLTAFTTGGHGLLPRMDAVRSEISQFLAQSGTKVSP
jgi:pimeloyl-ACP methyl ester carboxylesterase